VAVRTPLVLNESRTIVTYEGARDLLASVHTFPGSYMIKAIGCSEKRFVQRIVAAARKGLMRAMDVHYTVRFTPRRIHVAVTLELTVLTPDEVLAVYQALRVVKGLKLLL
jgi:putative lipoic acid-binding regulatory protein